MHDVSIQASAPARPEDQKHIGQLQKHRETQHLEKAYPPPRMSFSSEKRTQSSINPL